MPIQHNCYRLFSFVLLLLLGACSSMPATQSGFLKNATQLTVSGDGSRALFRSPERINPQQLQDIIVEWVVPPVSDVSSEERVQLMEHLRAAIAAEIKVLPALEGGRPFVIRAAITRVEVVSPALNTVSTVLLFAPLDRGGAAVEIEVLDTQTREPLASLARAEFTPMADFKARFTRLAPVELALQRAAADLADVIRREESLRAR